MRETEAGPGRPRRPPRSLIAIALAALLLSLDAGAQQSPPASEAQAKPAEATPAASPADAGNDELEILVAPIALYPDALLALVLQAATQPLEVVAADRFLQQRAKDPALKPKPEWDTSVVGLLNYPTVLARMSRDLDWTQALGDAVLDQLPELQAAVQQVRSELQAAGVLKSNDKQVVVVDSDIIRIQPAQPDVIYVPIYEPPPRTEAATGGATTVSSAAAPVAAPSEPTSITQTTNVTAAPAPAYGAPGYPGYPAYPAPVYSDPYPSYWATGATFLGGAVVGGMLGYALGDDDDCCDCCGGGGDFSGANINRGSGNTINIDRSINTQRTQQAQAQLRAKSSERRANAGQARTQAAARPQPTAAAAGGGRADARREAGRMQPSQPASGFGDMRSGRETQAERQRGERSRNAAPQPAAAARDVRGGQQAGARPQGGPAGGGAAQVSARPQGGSPQVAARAQAGGAGQARAQGGDFGGQAAARSHGGGGAFAGAGGGGREAQASHRGSASRGAAAGGHGGGRGGGRR